MRGWGEEAGEGLCGGGPDRGQPPSFRLDPLVPAASPFSICYFQLGLYFILFFLNLENFFLVAAGAGGGCPAPARADHVTLRLRVGPR